MIIAALFQTGFCYINWMQYTSTWTHGHKVLWSFSIRHLAFSHRLVHIAKGLLEKNTWLPSFKKSGVNAIFSPLARSSVLTSLEKEAQPLFFW